MFQFETTLRDSRATLVRPGTGTAVIISTRGRPDIVAGLVRQLDAQTNPPAHIFVIASSTEDAAELDQERDNLTIRIGRTGSGS